MNPELLTPEILIARWTKKAKRLDKYDNSYLLGMALAYEQCARDLRKWMDAQRDSVTEEHT